MKRFLFLGLIVIAVGNCKDALAEKPTMMPREKDKVIQEGSELEIKCHSEGVSVHFSFPKSSFMSPRSNYTISTAVNGTSTFLRQNAIFLDTGWYACAAEGIEIENNFKNLNHTHDDIAWVYIYVNSSEPFADRYYDFPKSIIVLADHSAVVPCRPTAPDMNVQLWRNSKIVRLGKDIYFNPQIGFIIKQLVFEELVIHFHCEIRGTTDRYDLYYSKARGQKPRIKTGVEERSIDEGTELRIECYGKFQKQFFVPTTSKKTDFLDIKTSEYEIIDEGNDTSTFLRRSTIFGDTGWYGCSEQGINLDIPFHNYIDYTRTEIDWIYVYVGSLSAPTRLLGGDKGNSILRENKVQYVDGSDINIPCRPTSPISEVQIECVGEELEQNAHGPFNPKYGSIMRHKLNDSLIMSGCFCIIKPSARGVFILNRKVSKQEKELLVNPGQVILLTGEDLRLSYRRFNYQTRSSTTWIIPHAESNNRVELNPSTSPLHQGPDGKVWHNLNLLTLRNVTVNDSGEYIFGTKFAASAIQEKEYSLEILVVDRRQWDYRKLNLQKDSYTLVHRKSKDLRLIVDLQSFSSEIIQWVDPLDESIEKKESLDSERQRFHLTRRLRSMLVINDLTYEDSGVYQIKINTSVGNMVVNFTLDVQGPPITSMVDDTQPYYAVLDEYFHVSCCSVGWPRPNITWTFLNQPKYPANNDSNLESPLEHKYVANATRTGCSYLNMKTNASGILTCSACNLINCSEATRRIVFTGSVGRFSITGPTELLFLGDDIALKCAGSIHAFTKLFWEMDFDECYANVIHNNMFYVEENSTEFAIEKVLYLQNVTECNRRCYSCIGQSENGNNEKLSYYLQLAIPQKPFFNRTNLGKAKILLHAELNNNKTWTMTCCADGRPRPNVTWFMDDLRLNESQEHHFPPNTCELDVVLDLRDEKNIKHTCKAENRFGIIEDYIDFVIEGEEDKTMLFLVIAIIFIIIGVVIGWFVLRKRRKDRARKKFREAILARFDRGALNYVQLDVNMASQAEILPFDKEWEYPRKLLKFEKVLGSGAFGIVRKAEAKSICRGEKATMVAVKMVRATHRLHYMTALIRELKVLVHLGSHLNIVNLLGACTNNISYGELLVIVEFCRFGNLRDYLIHCRSHFIDQNDPVTNEIMDPNYETDHVSGKHNREYVSDCDGDSDIVNNCSSTDAPKNNANVNDEHLADDLVKPGLRCHYRADAPDLIVDSICTKDLLCWAWQVTRGMRYLGLRKVVHGDLAARNVLLADNNVVKICDFGLAEILYKDEDYMKLGQHLLPIPWMAVESIRDRVFSFKSDIWSFGILLWEFFTLAKTPYYGMNPRHLHQKLTDGYRLSQPEYAPEKIYRMMMDCWDANPEQRPSFSKLEDDIANQLDNGIHTYYSNMIPGYTELIDKPAETGKIDYLTMDPSQIKTVSFSAGEEKVEFGKVPSDEYHDSACPSTSHNI